MTRRVEAMSCWSSLKRSSPKRLWWMLFCWSTRIQVGVPRRALPSKVAAKYGRCFRAKLRRWTATSSEMTRVPSSDWAFMARRMRVAWAVTSRSSGQISLSKATGTFRKPGVLSMTSRARSSVFTSKSSKAVATAENDTRGSPAYLASASKRRGSACSKHPGQFVWKTHTTWSDAPASGRLSVSHASPSKMNRWYSESIGRGTLRS
mmetsp:Transcript_38354/g.123002  ORF Transcript_38354/g.123002 Transcript_38354/m.123002 type:complete len:206 (-) Transcript_38354:1-618(-)